ncbi:MAG: hypothetical protein RLZZ282_170 [Verrucomicrobiota bacterium]
MDWQPPIAALIVIVTLAIFLVRCVRPRKRQGCSHDCRCGKKVTGVARGRSQIK